MANRLVILSDLWGSKKGLWITSYLGYLQQYFDIVYYDTQQLADLDVDFPTAANVCEAFDNGGLERGVRNLLAREKDAGPSHYLAFCAGGSIAWRAALEGLQAESIYAVSPLCLHREQQAPHSDVTLVFGEYGENRPSRDWALRLGVQMEVIPRFGQECYTDEKIIQKVCKDLLSAALRKQYQNL
jgi:hypothetical protein